MAISIRKLQNFIPQSRLDNACRSLRRTIKRHLDINFLRIDRTGGGLIVSRQTTTHDRIVNRLRLNRLIRNAITDLGPFNTFVSFSNVANLLRVGRVDGGCMRSLSTILRMNRPVGTIIITLSTRHGHVSLSAHILRGCPNRFLGSPSAIVTSTRGHVNSIDHILTRDRT